MNDQQGQPRYDPAIIGALAHLYRGELYRSKIWRTRLDTTTNWAVATTGIAISVSFSHTENSPLPLLLVWLLVMVFLIIEARRYRYFDIFRTRVRLMEVSFYGPLLSGEGVKTKDGWNRILRQDYLKLHFHIGFLEAAGRRLRRNYIWIFSVLAVSYFAKLLVHPTALDSWEELWRRAALGPVPGHWTAPLLAAGYLLLLAITVWTLRDQQASGRVESDDGPDPAGQACRRF